MTATQPDTNPGPAPTFPAPDLPVEPVPPAAPDVPQDPVAPPVQDPSPDRRDPTPPVQPGVGDPLPNPGLPGGSPLIG